MTQIYLFTGDNTYALRQEVRRWSRQFAQKHGAENLLVRDGAKLTAKELLDEVAVMPFLSEHRLVFVDGVPSFTKEQAQMVKEQIHPAVLLVFIDDPAKRKAAGKRTVAKDVVKIADETKDFPALNPRSLQTWIVDTARAQGATLAPSAVAALIELCGSEQDMLATEIDKLALYKPSGEVTRTDVEDVVAPSEEGIIWKITDHISAGNAKQAAIDARRYIERGGEPHALWAVLLGFVKNVAIVYAALQSGASTAPQVAAKTGMSPYALRTLVPFAQRIDERRMETLLDRAVQADIDLKSGGVRATDEWPGELEALIDWIILSA